MSRLLRFFSLTSLLMVIGAAIALSLYSTHSLRQTLLDHGEADNLAVASIIANALDEPLQQLQQLGDHNSRGFMQGALRRLLEGRSITQVAFYTPAGRLLYAQREGASGVLSEKELRRLQAGKPLSLFVTRATPLAPLETAVPQHLIFSLVPIQNANGQLTAVVGLYNDITELYLRSEDNRWRINSFSITVLVLLYLFLFVVARYADRQLRRQHQQLDDSLTELKLARHDLERRVDQRTQILAREVEERRLVEQMLREQESYLHATMENVFNAIICIDSHGYIRSFNRTAEKMFGYDQQEVLGKNVKELMPQRYRDLHDGYLQRYMETGEQHIIGSLRELSARRKDGSVFPIELAITESVLSHQTIFIGTIRDLTEQKNAERELDEARQKYYHQEKMAAIGNLAAGLVHEIGNPTAAVSGLLDGLCDSEGSCSPELRDQLQLVQEQVQRIIQITRDVSEFSNPQGQEPQLLDLNALIGRTCRLMRHDKRFRGVELKLELDNQIPACFAVADYLVQILMNLLVNAMDAIDSSSCAGGEIRVASGIDQQRVWFLVEDNGTGMDDEVLAHAREAFYTTKPVGKGTGLGLSLCDSLITAQDGELQIDSEPGQGTRVRVRLPIQPAAEG